MTGITHKQARRFLYAAADGWIREDQRALLDAHLSDCASCRAEAEAFSLLEARLKQGLQVRWRNSDGPSENMVTAIHTRTRRIMMTNRINAGLRTMAAIAMLMVAGF